MSSSLKSKVDFDVEKYMQLLDVATEFFSKNEENGFLDFEVVEKFCAKNELPCEDYFLFRLEPDDMLQDALAKLTDAATSELPHAEYLTFIKRAFILHSQASDFQYIFQKLANQTTEITRDTFVQAQEGLPPLKAGAQIIQAMIDAADGFPITSDKFRRLLIITGYVDQRINALDSIVSKKTRGRARKKAKPNT